MIYISTPPENLPPREARENIAYITSRLLNLGVLVIDPLKLGIPDAWSPEQKMEKRATVIQEQATAIFLQKDWNRSEMARNEFFEVARLNQHRSERLKIQIYFEDFHGFIDIESDVRYKVLRTKISEVSYKR